MAERMAVGLLHGRADGGADMREEVTRADVPRQLAEVLVVPRGLDAAEHPGSGLLVIPADAEAITVGSLGPEPGMQALVDQRVNRGIEHLREQDG
jgi:hypothetical protein